MFTPESQIPRPWREYLDCKQCKRSLVQALGLVYLRTAKFLLINNQILVLAGCFNGERQDEAWEITAGSSIPDVNPLYKTNAPEADMRVWRHATQCKGKRILLYSPDTDVYNIGLVQVKQDCQYVVQINLPQNAMKYIDMHKMLQCFKHDPDLAPLHQHKLGSIMLQFYNYLDWM